MRLTSLEIYPEGKNGWQSEKLFFGDDITLLYGPNGCAKTPLLQFIAFCLGYPCVFRADIYEKCSHAELEADTNKGPLKIRRQVARQVVDITVAEPNGNHQRFYDEKEFSTFLLDWIGYRTDDLVTSQSTLTSPYVATLLPFFYLDQDDGYSKFYCPPSSFIKDQFSEMARIVFGLPIKNSYDSKKKALEIKQRIDYLDREIKRLGEQVSLIRETDKGIDSEATRKEIFRLGDELEALKNSNVKHDHALSVFDSEIRDLQQNIEDLSREESEILKRKNSINQIATEINSEIETLNLNEEARRIFLSFNEICGSDDCRMFQSSSESYAKNLLYLKDQIKDLVRNSETEEKRLQSIHEIRSNYLNRISDLQSKKDDFSINSEIAALIEAMSAINRKIFDLHDLLAKSERLSQLENSLLEKVVSRDQALDTYASLTSSTSTPPALLKVRADLRREFIDWLETLHTPNISKDITFRDDFWPIMGNEQIAHLKGSTKIRAVLAFHAALVKIVSGISDNGFRFLILDTPKQHEIHNDDLDRYFQGLKRALCKHSIQVIFSSTEYHYDGDANDNEWTPKFEGKEQKMFLAEPQVIAFHYFSSFMSRLSS